jgi:hypothetical protein
MNATESFVKARKTKSDADKLEDLEAADDSKYFCDPSMDLRDKAYQGSNVFMGFDADPAVQDRDGTTLRTGAHMALCCFVLHQLTAHLEHRG